MKLSENSFNSASDDLSNGSFLMLIASSSALEILSSDSTASASWPVGKLLLVVKGIGFGYKISKKKSLLIITVNYTYVPPI